MLHQCCWAVCSQLRNIHTSAALLPSLFPSPLPQLKLLTAAEAESVIALEFNPVRAGFHGGAGET